MEEMGEMGELRDEIWALGINDVEMRTPYLAATSHLMFMLADWMHRHPQDEEVLIPIVFSLMDEINRICEEPTWAPPKWVVHQMNPTIALYLEKIRAEGN